MILYIYIYSQKSQGSQFAKSYRNCTGELIITQAQAYQFREVT